MPSAGPLPRTSIIVVSRHRPRHLARCLDALARQSHPDCEIVLVADPGSVDIRPDLPLKRCAFDVPNISQARNRGIALAAGAVLAFIDDDAIAVPDWASALARPFADPRVLAATGFTRGPDGLSWQARAERMTPSGRRDPSICARPRCFPPTTASRSAPSARTAPFVATRCWPSAVSTRLSPITLTKAT